MASNPKPLIRELYVWEQKKWIVLPMIAFIIIGACSQSLWLRTVMIQVTLLTQPIPPPPSCTLHLSYDKPETNSSLNQLKPVCNKMSLGRLHLHSGIISWGPYYSSRWGNVLSPYWQGRAMSALGNYSFKTFTFGAKTWMKYLPTNSDPFINFTNYEQFRIACKQCDGIFWEFAHECVGAWDHIQPIIQKDTQNAIKSWLSINGKSLPDFEHNDWYIYDRCAEDTILNNNGHGPISFSAMNVIPYTVTRIFIFQSREGMTPTCVAIAEARKKFLLKRYSRAEVHFAGSSVDDDFIKLVFAPNLIVGSVGSSFALWGSLANSNDVYRFPSNGRINGKINTFKIPSGLKFNEKNHWFDPEKVKWMRKEVFQNSHPNNETIVNWLKNTGNCGASKS